MVLRGINNRRKENQNDQAQADSILIIHLNSNLLGLNKVKRWRIFMESEKPVGLTVKRPRRESLAGW